MAACGQGTPEEYAYDATTGNLAAKAGVNYTYNSGHAHAVSSAGSNTYAYDANGNMTERVVGGQAFNLGYDAENRLVSVSGAVTASFLYDGDGGRVRSTVDGTTTCFVGNIYEKSGTQEIKYYYAGAARIAMRVGTADPYYLLSDHLGSTTVTTDASGNLVTELRYKPWGEVRMGTASTSYTFTGQYSNVDDIGLMFYNARWYDPALSRFTSADSIVPAGMQGWDRYAYVNNSPVNYTDPTGHFGKHRDDMSDYWNKRNQQKVKNLEAKWEREKAVKGLKALVQATNKEIVMDPSLALAWGGGGAGKPMFGMLGEGEPPPKPIVSIVGAALVVKLGVLDTVLGIGIISTAITAVTVPGAQLGLAGELILIPLEFISINLTIAASEMALKGSMEVDPLPLLHLFRPDWLPYER